MDENCEIETKKNKLDKYLINLNEKKYVTDPAIGRDDIIEELVHALLRLNKPNAILIGKAGVGKTAIVEGLAYRIKKNKIAKPLENKKIMQISSSHLVAGCRYRGDFEERIQLICDYVKNNPDIILFIDEFHTTFNAGGAEGAIGMHDILKPYLARGEIKVIGATTSNEFEKLKKDSAYLRRFDTVYVEEPDLTTTSKILENSLKKFEIFYNIKIDKKLCNHIVNCSRNLKGNLPDKAIDLLERVCTDTVYNNKSTFGKKDIDKIEEMLEAKKALILE